MRMQLDADCQGLKRTGNNSADVLLRKTEITPESSAVLPLQVFFLVLSFLCAVRPELGIQV